MNWKRIALAVGLVATLAAAPLSNAEAHWRGGGWGGAWPFWAGAAALGTAAVIASTPWRAPYYYPPYPYYAPVYYPPAPYYYAPRPYPYYW